MLKFRSLAVGLFRCMGQFRKALPDGRGSESWDARPTARLDAQAKAFHLFRRGSESWDRALTGASSAQAKACATCFSRGQRVGTRALTGAPRVHRLKPVPPVSVAVQRIGRAP